MERITFFIRTSKSQGSIKLRFRLREGREVELYHKSEIKADLKDLSKFTIEGTLKAKVSVFNQDLKNQIDNEMNLMRAAYQSLCERMDKTHITGELFEAEIASIENPVEPVIESETLLKRYERFIVEGFRDKIFGEGRKRHYNVVLGSLKRYLAIKHLSKITPNEFDSNMLMDLMHFFAEEYTYVEKYPKVFADMKTRDLPKQVRERNTVITRMKKLQAFFNELEERDEIEISPFRKLGKKRKAQVMREEYDDPRFLHKDEFLQIMVSEVPKELQETKDVFLLQCSFGCRISDFKALTMDKVSVSEDGIPYIHYLPQKTKRENASKAEVETPIMKFALDIIKQYEFKFPILKYVSGKSGYNVKIKKLLEHCKIERLVKIYDEAKGDNVFLPLHEFGSSKLCRSTHVDMMRKVQVDLYASGLHKEGSKAVHRYTMSELADRFTLMCAAFNQPKYKVNSKLEIIS
ncbi:MAG: hypothetical protein J1F16_01960 [Muribaculaceae bacterium]|nr:hypothetical protein [Muribaculaceae bacterium]